MSVYGCVAVSVCGAGPVTVGGECRVAWRLYAGMRVVLSCGGMKKVGRMFGITRNFVYLQSGSAWRAPHMR